MFQLLWILQSNVHFNQMVRLICNICVTKFRTGIDIRNSLNSAAQFCSCSSKQANIVLGRLQLQNKRLIVVINPANNILCIHACVIDCSACSERYVRFVISQLPYIARDYGSLCCANAPKFNRNCKRWAKPLHARA